VRFVDELVLPEDAIRGRHLEVVRPRADEHVFEDRSAQLACAWGACERAMKRT